MLKNSKGNLIKSGTYGYYTNSILSTFEILASPEKIASLTSLSEGEKAMIESAIYLVYPRQDDSPEINNIIYKVNLDDKVEEPVERDENTIKIFYSWQSDIMANKSGIRNAIGETIKLLNKDYSQLKFEIDSDVRGTPGSQDIPTTLFNKIKNSDIFLADVSLVGENSLKDSKKTQKYIPNPNVMIELGYAAGVLGWNRTLMVMNLGTNTIEELPFDINKRIVVGYKSQKGSIKALGNRIYLSIKNIIDDILKERKENNTLFSFIKDLPSNKIN